jgi:hypothetical protein
VQKGVRLQIVNDRRYPGISNEILGAMAKTFPGASPRVHPSSVGESDVLCISHPAVLRASPQHGAGRKHLRPIVLEDWQLELTHAHPEALLRGLIHSDGCRVANRFRTKLPSGCVADYSYVRYFFTNMSADIRRIFFEHCELLGIPVTQSNHRNLTVSHRKSVAILEQGWARRLSPSAIDERCGRRDSNPHELSPPAPKAGASANFATPARPSGDSRPSPCDP